MQSTQSQDVTATAVPGTSGPTNPQSRTASDSERLRKADVLGVLDRQNRCCALTGRQLVPAEANIDHIIPLVKGGKHVVSNIQILHKEVNLAKGSLTQEEFIALCREVVAHADADSKPLTVIGHMSNYVCRRNDDGDMCDSADVECPQCQQTMSLHLHGKNEKCRCGYEWSIETTAMGRTV